MSSSLTKNIATLVTGGLLAYATTGVAMAADATIDSIIVKYKQQPSKLSAEHVIAGMPLSKVTEMSSGAVVYSLPQSIGKTSEQNIENMLKALRANPNVKYAEPNRVKHMLKEPNDSRYYEQWHYYEKKGGINLPKAWDITTGKDVTVAVVDTGITKHENLEKKILPGHSFVDDDNAADDPTDHGGETGYHGTHVAGTIAANSNHHHVVAGVAWEAKVVPVRVLGSDGSGSDSQVIEGVRWAAGLNGDNENPARVINLSLGGDGECGAAWQETIDEAIEKGVVFAVAAGNETQDANNSSPANCEHVITVAATGRKGKKAFYSNYGDRIDIAAPGGDQGWFGWPKENGILSTTNPGNYEFMQGTSMASPHIAGIAALMVSVNQDLTPQEVKDIMQETAKGSVFGVGLVDAYAAVKKAKAKATQASAA